MPIKLAFDASCPSCHHRSRYPLKISISTNIKRIGHPSGGHSVTTVKVRALPGVLLSQTSSSFSPSFSVEGIPF